MSELARKLVAASWWEWKAGMVIDGIPGPITHVINGMIFAHGDWQQHKSPVPDIEHPSTIGHLMAMLWEVDHKAHTYCNAGRWYVLFVDTVDEASPGEALAAALLAVKGES